MISRTAKRLLLLSALSFQLLSCESPPRRWAPETPNVPVVLISIDGLRWDEPKLFAMTSVLSIGENGVSAESLEPVYPSKTFPNHYTMVTGCYSDEHGIVGNEFYDPVRKQAYSIADKKVSGDGSWYLCEPIWLKARKAGLHTASFFWPGSDADIDGQYPDRWYPYDDKISAADRVKQVLVWLKEPSSTRPSFITLYFSDVDTKSHKFGTLSKETREAAEEIDHEVGRLLSGIRRLDFPVNVILVSDHGMRDTDFKQIEFIEDYADLHDFKVIGHGPQALLYYMGDAKHKKTAVNSMQKKLQTLDKEGSRHWRVWQPLDVPENLHFSKSPRVGDLIIDMDSGWSVQSKTSSSLPVGNHGWNAKSDPNMLGVFYASGPRFRIGQKIPSLQNREVDFLLEDLLGVKAHSDSVLNSILDSGPTAVH